MSANPLRTIKNRLTAAIDWRAREAARVDEAVLQQLGATITDQAAELARHMAEVRATLDELSRRISALEGEERP